MPGLITRDDAPEVVFRGVLPSDTLLATVREQDALLCSVVRDVPTSRRITMSRERAGYRVLITGQYHDRALSGQSEHVRVDVALLHAYSELLRSLHERSPMPAYAA